MEHICGLKESLLRGMVDSLRDRETRTVVKVKILRRREVASRVPQGSAGTLIFLIYVKDLIDGRNSNTSRFTDDEKGQEECIHREMLL